VPTLPGQTGWMASKYAPLSRYLGAQADDEPVSLTWFEVEGLVGPLPPSASIRQWWANTGGSPRSVWGTRSSSHPLGNRSPTPHTSPPAPPSVAAAVVGTHQ
jgi:hypothetical protein